MGITEPFDPAVIQSGGTANSQVIHSVGEQPNVTVLSIPYLSFVELEQGGAAQLPAFERLKATGEWAAMNVRVPFKGLESVYATWGAGQMTDARGAQGWNAGERRNGQRGAAMLERFSGAQGEAGPTAAAAVLVPDMESIRAANAAGVYLPEPGLLGSTLQAQGIRIAVWSDLDLPGGGGEHYRRPAPLMVMNEHGLVEHGRVGERLFMERAGMPYGVQTRYDWLLAQWQKERGAAAAAGSLQVIELGDLYRLYEEKARYAPDAFVQTKRLVLEQLDLFLGELMRAMGEDSMRGVLWLVSPQVHTDAKQEKMLLTPAVRWLPNSSGSKWLTSETTRRLGVIAAVDLAPSLLREYGLSSPKEIIGRPVMAAPASSGSATLDALLVEVRNMSKIYALRPPMLYSLAGYEIGAMLLGLTFAWRRRLRSRGQLMLEQGAERSSVWWGFAVRGMLFSVLLLPALLLSMGWLVAWSVPWLVGYVLVGVLAGGAIVAYVTGGSASRLIAALGWIGGVVSALIIADGLTGAEAMKHSVLGYDVLIGARYYGIGNEFMGVLLGAAVLGLSAGLQARARRRPAAARAAHRLDNRIQRKSSEGHRF
ncbi:hypothetical protein, partial [Paenibacillus cremeus]